MVNSILVGTCISFLISQLVKFFILLTKGKSYAREALYREYGGMPSSHTAVVFSVVFGVYFLEGFSNLFFVSLLFAFVVVVDVIDSKWFYGKRDSVLNELIRKHNCSEKTKVEAIEGDFGHSLLEVFVGLFIAFVVSFGVWVLI